MFLSEAVVCRNYYTFFHVVDLKSSYWSPEKHREPSRTSTRHIRAEQNFAMSMVYI